MSRPESIMVRSARIRAAVTAFVNNAPSFVTIKMVDDALVDNYKALGYDHSPIESSMHLLSSTGVFRKLGRLNTPKGEAAFIANGRDITDIPELQGLRPVKKQRLPNKQKAKPEAQTEIDLSLPADQPVTKRLPEATPEELTRPLADLTVDVLKDTGRVRLTIGGMTIDIGVK